MILVDTSIWIDHLHKTEPGLVALLEDTQVCTHPMIIGELALGSLQNRAVVLRLLADLPTTPIASHSEVLHLVEAHALSGLGLSLVDAHLLAALQLSAADQLWTRDRRLRSAAQNLAVAADVSA